MFKKHGKESETPSNSPEENKFGFKPGKAYMLIGGEPKDILTSCDACGSAYLGTCQGACLHCQKERKTFYVDVTDVKLVESVGVEKLNDASSFVLPNKDTVSIDDGSEVSETVANKVIMGWECKSDLIVANKVGLSPLGNYGTVIISDGGMGIFEKETAIKTLVTGKNVTLQFSNYCRVNELLTMGEVNMTAGLNFKQGNRKNTSYSEVAKMISDRLNS